MISALNSGSRPRLKVVPGALCCVLRGGISDSASFHPELFTTGPDPVCRTVRMPDKMMWFTCDGLVSSTGEKPNSL